MTEALKDTLTKGYANWRSNLVLGVPTMLQVIGSIVTFFLAVIFSGIYLGMLSNQGEILDYVIYAILMVLGLLIYLLMNSFLSAASFGMSKKAVESGKVNLGMMMEYGQRNAISIFTATLMYFFAVIISGIILLGPGIFVQAVFQQTKIAMSLLLIGLVVYITFLVGLVFVYTPLPAVITAGNLGAVEGIRESYAFAKKNKIKLLTLFSSYFGLIWVTNLILGMLMNPFSTLSEFIPL